MQYQNFDYIILGGGCSALSLASNISDKKIDRYSFLILESRIKYEDDRSWCFWEEKKSKMNYLVSCSWKSFSFGVDNRKIIHNSQKYDYKYIRSIDFYNKTVKKIIKTPNINLKLGEVVKNVSEQNQGFLVHTNKHSYLTKYIIDTRPKKNIYLKSPFLFQSFLGYEIKVKEDKSVFNIAKIMDNMRVKNNLFIFDYILPLKKNVFLIEITAFSKNNVPINTLKLLLNETLKKQRLTGYKIVRKEHGVIPMGFIDNKKISKTKNYFLAGSLGGAIRPSSGYAFLRIQEWASHCAELLKKNKQLTSHPKEKLIIKKLDMIFLKTLIDNLPNAPFIFNIFLSRVSTDSFIRFMKGNANIIDYLKIIYSMPKKIFLKTLAFKNKNEI